MQQQKVNDVSRRPFRSLCAAGFLVVGKISPPLPPLFRKVSVESVLPSLPSPPLPSPLLLTFLRRRRVEICRSLSFLLFLPWRLFPLLLVLVPLVFPLVLVLVCAVLVVVVVLVVLVLVFAPLRLRLLRRLPRSILRVLVEDACTTSVRDLLASTKMSSRPRLLK